MNINKLTDYPACDLCGGHDLNSLLVEAYDRESQADYSVCPDCKENHESLVTESDLNWS